MLENKLKEGITICTRCIHQYPIEEKTIQYVTYSPKYISMCNATEKKVRCKDRNKKGECEYYEYVGRDFPI